MLIVIKGLSNIWNRNLKTELEPRSPPINQNKYPSLLDREIVQKLFKSLQPNIMTKFEQISRYGKLGSIALL